MAESIQQKVKRLVEESETMYHRLILIVGESGTGKTYVLKHIADELGLQIINVNSALSTKLLELTQKQRPIRLPELIKEITGIDKSTIILDNLELLFDTELKQDPLRLLQNISRNRCVMASWRGTLKGNKLIYAEVGHREYRSYDSRGVLVVSMDGTSTVD